MSINGDDIGNVPTTGPDHEGNRLDTITDALALWDTVAAAAHVPAQFRQVLRTGTPRHRYTIPTDATDGHAQVAITNPRSPVTPAREAEIWSEFRQILRDLRRHATQTTTDAFIPRAGFPPELALVIWEHDGQHAYACNRGLTRGQMRSSRPRRRGFTALAPIPLLLAAAGTHATELAAVVIVATASPLMPAAAAAAEFPAHPATHVITSAAPHIPPAREPAESRAPETASSRLISPSPKPAAPRTQVVPQVTPQKTPAPEPSPPPSLETPTPTPAPSTPAEPPATELSAIEETDTPTPQPSTSSSPATATAAPGADD